MNDGMLPPPLTTVKVPPSLWAISAPLGENHCPIPVTLDPELQYITPVWLLLSASIAVLLSTGLLFANMPTPVVENKEYPVNLRYVLALLYLSQSQLILM